MSCHDQARLEEALKVLDNTPKEALQSHRAQILLAFRKLEALVKDLLISQVESSQSVEVEGPFTANPDCHSQSPTTPNISDPNFLFNTQASKTSVIHSGSILVPNLTDGHGSLSSLSILRLVQALDDDSSQIKDFLHRLQFEAAGDNLKPLFEDPRIVDLQVESCRPSLKVRFRKGLSQRSLANEFTEWEHCTYGWSRVSVLAGNLSISRRDGHIAEYLERNAHRFKNQKAIRAGIQHGIKMLVCERLLGKRAISAILCFKYRRLRVVKLEELESLVMMMSQKGWIEELVNQKADWLDECQRKYNEWCDEVLQRLNQPTFSAKSDRKRRRLNGKAMNIQSAAAEVEVNTSSRKQDNGLETFTESNISGSDGAVSVSRVASSKFLPLVSQQNFTHRYDFGTLTPANPLSVPEEGSRYQYDFATLTPANPFSIPEEGSRCEYDFATLTPANPLSIPQKVSRYQNDSAMLTPANAFSIPQKVSRYQDEYAALREVNHSSLLPDPVQFRFEPPSISW